MDINRYVRLQAWASGVIAIFTVVLAGVGIQQCAIMREADRPSIGGGFDLQTMSPPQAGKRLTLELVLPNFGRRGAYAYIKSTIVYSVEEMAAPPLSDTESHTLVWPGMVTTHPVEGPQEITEGQITDMRAGDGYLYIRAVIRYGENRKYHTAICTEVRVKLTPNAQRPLVFRGSRLCKNPDSNSMSE